MNVIRILLIINLVLDLFISIDSFSQTQYKWINIPDSVKSDKHLLAIMRERIDEAAQLNEKDIKFQINKEQIIAKEKNDSLELSCGDYLIASIHDINGNYVDAIFNYKAALNVISVTNHAYLVATLNSKMAYSMNRIGKYDSALIYYDISLAIREKNGYKLGVINTKNFIGNVQRNMGLYEQAFQNYTEALQLIPDSTLNNAKAFTYTNMGWVLIEAKNYTLAEKYFKEGLALRQRSKNDFLIAHSYKTLGRLFYEKGELDLAVDYCLKSSKAFEKRNWKKPLPIIYNLLALCYLSKKEYKTANKYLAASNEIAAEEKNQLELAKNFINYGRLHIETREYELSIKYLLQAIELAEMIKARNIILEAKNYISDAYFYSNKYKEAFLAKKEFEKLQTQLFSNNFAEQVASFVSSKEIEKANTIFELQQKENALKEEARIKEEKFLKNIYLVSSLIFLVFVFILYRNFRLKSKTNQRLANSNIAIAKKQKEIIDQKNILEKQKTELTDTLKNLQLLTKAIEQSSSTVVITNVKGEIEYVNPKFTETTGYSFEEAVGKNPRILKSGDKSPDFYKEMWDTLLQGEEWHGEFENIRKDGRKYVEHASIASVKSEEGEISHFIAVKEDITEKQKILSKLEELNAIQIKLFSVIGHDLKGPLGSIKAMLELVEQKEYVQENKELSKIIGVTLKSVISTFFLSENLFNWARSWRDGGSSNPSSFDLNDNIIESVELLSSISSQKNIKLLPFTNESLIVFADSEMVSTVIRNLVANAIKFTPANGVVKLIANKISENEIEVIVKDNGIGIKKELIPILLDDRNLYSTPGTEQEKGSGLGLSICSQFVKINGGKFSIESEPGEGSTFRFTLPTKKLK